VNAPTRRALLQSGLGAGLFTLVPRQAFGAAPAQLSGSKIKGDIAILRAAYTQMHPGLYRYATPAQMAARFDVLERDWSRDQSLASAYLSLSHFLASIKCGHSYANFYNQSEAVQRQLFGDIPRLPILFRWINGQIVITCNQSEDESLMPGTTVTRINGVATQAILKRLIPLIRADGSNDAKRIALLELRAEDEWESFDIFFNLVFPGAATYALDLIDGDGRVSKASVAPISLDKRRAAKRNSAQARADGSVWNIDYRADGVAILTMPDWGLYDSKWDWAAYLDTCFAELDRRKTKALIVDIRGNEGGLDCGNAVIARMIDTPLTVEAVERRVRYRTMPAALKPYLDTWDPSFATLGEGAQDLRNGFFRLDAGPANSIAPKGPRFGGKLILLCDAQNSSATFQFANIVKSYKLGTVIGAPTGGNRRGINGGSFYFLRLPNSGLEADLPLVGFFRTTPQPDAGLVPDINITLSARDIAINRDPAMERALLEAAS
jgi:Peptidase family S41